MQCRTMKLLAVWLCVFLLVTVVWTQEEGEESERTGPPKPVFQEPSYPSGDVYFVETFTHATEVWDRFV